MTPTDDLHRCYRAWSLRSPKVLYGELWAEQPDHPARRPLERLAAKLGRDLSIDYTLTRTLLLDFLHAAGGVELHARRVLAALDRSQRNYSALVATSPEFGWQPEVPQYFAVEESLAWDYPNLLTWLRAVEDRLDRRVPRSAVRLGLIPASGEAELREDLKQASASFEARVGDERLLANYGLHAAKVPSPNTATARIEADGTLVVEIPDPPTEPVDVFDQFNYDDGRDLRTFAAEALAATDELVDAVLGAFERAQARAVEAREAAATTSEEEEASSATENDNIEERDN